MNELNKFKGKLQADKKLQKKMSEASTIKDVVQVASDAGCNVTEQEVKDDLAASISGGDISGDMGLGAIWKL